MEYTLIRAKRRSILFQIERTGQLVVRAPRWMSAKFIEQSIAGKIDWIKKTQKMMASRHQRLEPHQFLEGEEFLYLGQTYPLKYVDPHQIGLQFNDDFTLSKLHQPKAKQYFVKWYQKKAKEELTNRVLKYANTIGVNFASIKLSNASTRWGSCSHSGNLNFCWRLIMAPPSVIDYVVVHELAHIKEHNHSAAFWRVVEGVMPDYKQRRRWIKDNGYSLEI